MRIASNVTRRYPIYGRPLYSDCRAGEDVVNTPHSKVLEKRFWINILNWLEQFKYLAGIPQQIAGNLHLDQVARLPEIRPGHQALIIRFRKSE